MASWLCRFGARSWRSPRPLACAVESLRDTSDWDREAPGLPDLGHWQNTDSLERLFWGREGPSSPSWKRKEPGPPITEPLVIWGRRGVDLTSCLNLALVEFFNRGYDPPSSLSQAFLTYSSNQFFPFGSNSALHLGAWGLTEGEAV